MAAIGNVVANLADKASGAAGNLMDRASGAAGNLMDRASGAAGNLLDKTSGAVGDVLTKAAQDMNGNNLVQAYFDSLNAKNYSQCGLLLKEGQLGQEAFIAGTLIEGVVKSHQLSTEAHSRMQVMMADIMQKLLEGQKEFEVRLTDFQSKRDALVKNIQASYQESVQELQKSALKAMFDPNVPEGKLKFTIEQLTKLNETYLQQSTQLVESQGISKEFFEKSMGIRGKMFASMERAVTTVSKGQQSVAGEFIKAAKELSMKLVEGRNSNAANAGDQVKKPLLLSGGASAAAAGAASAGSARGVVIEELHDQKNPDDGKAKVQGPNNS